MHTTKLTPMEDSLGLVLPNSEPLILSQEILALFNAKVGDEVMIAKKADGYRLSFQTATPKGTISVTKENGGYRILSPQRLKQLRKSHALRKAKYLSATLKPVTPRTSSVRFIAKENLKNIKTQPAELGLTEQLQLGREFMSEFEETFQALAQ